MAVPLHGSFGAETIPEAQEHLELFPARILAVAGNSLGTLAVVAVAVATFRRRPRGNALVLAGVAVAALGSALFGLGIAGRPRHSRLRRASSTAASSSAASSSPSGTPRERHQTQAHSPTMATIPLSSAMRPGCRRGRGRPRTSYSIEK